MYWDYSQYNVVVKQVEGCSDLLRETSARIAPYIRSERISRRLQKHLEAAARELDKRAIRMLALYDGAAQQMIRDGVTYDKRRDLFKIKSEPFTKTKRSAVERTKLIQAAKPSEAKP